MENCRIECAIAVRVEQMVRDNQYKHVPFSVLVHDNACKFSSFVKNRRNSTPLMEHLASLDYRVDRHHFKNHVGALCKQNNDPDDCEMLDGVNTSVMEQVNSWFGRYGHSARYMNAPRFNLYLLLACHLNNRYREHKRTELLVEDTEESYEELF